VDVGDKLLTIKRRFSSYIYLYTLGKIWGGGQGIRVREEGLGSKE
jgi:hypothetical protein